MITLISIILFISISIFLLFFKRKLIFKIKYKNVFYKSNLKNNFSYQKNLNIYSNTEKYYLKKQMLKLFKGSKKDKLDALNIARNLSDKSTLSILRIGLKDTDPDVIKLSAKLIEKFK